MKHNKPLSKKLFKLFQTIIVQNIYKLSLHSKSNNPDLNDVLFSEKEFIEEMEKESIPESICNNFNRFVFYEVSTRQRNLHVYIKSINNKSIENGSLSL